MITRFADYQVLSDAGFDLTRSNQQVTLNFFIPSMDGRSTWVVTGNQRPVIFFKVRTNERLHLNIYVGARIQERRIVSLNFSSSDNMAGYWEAFEIRSLGPQDNTITDPLPFIFELDEGSNSRRMEIRDVIVMYQREGNT
jgi:hypothetical protein